MLVVCRSSGECLPGEGILKIIHMLLTSVVYIKLFKLMVG